MCTRPIFRLGSEARPCNAVFECFSHGSELAERGTLREHIQKNRGQPDMKLSLRWAVDIAEGAYNYTHIKINITV